MGGRDLEEPFSYIFSYTHFHSSSLGVNSVDITMNIINVFTTPSFEGIDFD